jgi:hypothetical protein
MLNLAHNMSERDSVLLHRFMVSEQAALADGPNLVIQFMPLTRHATGGLGVAPS